MQDIYYEFFNTSEQLILGIVSLEGFVDEVAGNFRYTNVQGSHEKKLAEAVSRSIYNFDFHLFRLVQLNNWTL